MSKHSNNPSKAMKRGPMGMHGGHGPAEKAKDFKYHSSKFHCSD